MTSGEVVFADDFSRVGIADVLEQELGYGSVTAQVRGQVRFDDGHDANMIVV